MVTCKISSAVSLYSELQTFKVTLTYYEVFSHVLNDVDTLCLINKVGPKAWFHLENLCE